MYVALILIAVQEGPNFDRPQTSVALGERASKATWLIFASVGSSGSSVRPYSALCIHRHGSAECTLSRL